jgi:peptidoglycan/xylan/chitin deacetylase (PgdA/CDA1 family)
MPKSGRDGVGRRTFLAAAGGVVVSACSRRHRAATAVAPGAVTTTRERVPTSSGVGSKDLATFVRSGSRDRAAIALTFHGSGDLALLRGLLDAAARAKAPVTVFAVGQWLDANPQVAKTLLAAGHELANHTYTHPALSHVDRQGVAAEITRCRDALARHGGTSGKWFRPSGVEVATTLMLEEAARAGYATVVGYDVDPHDYQDPGAHAVANRSIAGMQPGAIVSLHTGHAGTVAAFERIVRGARAKGLEPVLLRDLLAA